MADVTSMLPLSRSLLHVLLALHEGERHGYAIKKRVEQLSGGIVKMGPGTLYTTIQRAEDLGFIVESEERGPAGEDQSQRRYYEPTSLGRQVLAAEIERVGAFIDHARAALSRAEGK